MKELSIEEKAKSYDEAIERAKELLEIGLKDTRDKRVVLSFFPELRESGDEKIRKALVEMVHDTTGDELWVDYNVHKEETLAWLKSLKERVGCEVNCTTTKEWSEEDKNRINRLIAYFEDKESFTAEDDIVYANWLKCLKDRYTWKPSDEQMDMLKIAVSTSNSIVLDSLYNDLMKLKE